MSKISLNEIIDVVKSIREVITEKGFDGNQRDRYFSAYCFLLEHSTCAHGWTPPMTLKSMAESFGKTEKTMIDLMIDMHAAGLIERERVGAVYRYRLVDLELNYEVNR